jgi:DNA primase
LGVPLTREFVAAVRNAGDIVRLVGDYVALKPAGSRLKGLCPFHQEKTPSFSVDPERGLFYCFGCQAGGDVFRFAMLSEQIDFPEAVEFLARRWAVPLPTADSPRDRLRRRVLEAGQVADGWFRERLADPGEGRKAREYLQRRGIGESTAEALGLGYAPDDWERLNRHLRERRFRPDEIEAAGLALRRKSGDGHYDRFRDRLIFPIRDVHGRPVAFGGRALGDGEPKYLNSPETPAYVKGEHLYGLDLARDAVRREGYAILVEGYLDLAAVRQAGLDNVVASLGTALTAAQARLLSRTGPRVVIAYDGDAAGIAAAARGLDALLEQGLEVRIADLPEGLDPDDLIRERGAETFVSLVREAPGWFDFLLSREIRDRDLGRPEEKVAAVNALLPRLARLGAVERSEWAGRMADALQLDEEIVLQELRQAVRAGRPAIRQRVEPRESLRPLDLRLVALLLESGEARVRLREELEHDDWSGSRAARVVETILRIDDENGGVHYPDVMAALESAEDRDLLGRAAFRDGGLWDLGESEWEACAEALRKGRLRRQGREMQRALAGADEAGVDDLLVRRMQIAKQIDTMS